MPKPTMAEDIAAAYGITLEEAIAKLRDEEEALDKRGDADEVALQRELARNPLNRYPGV